MDNYLLHFRHVAPLQNNYFLAHFWHLFHSFFQSTNKNYKKNTSGRPVSKKVTILGPLWGPGGGGHEVPFHIFFTHLGPFGPTWSPGDSGTPPNLHFSRFLERKSRCFTIFGVKIVEMLAESGDSFLLPKLKKKWRALRPVFLTLGGAFRQAEYRPLAFTPKLHKKNGGRSALYL